MSSLEFDASSYERQPDQFDPIPSGQYKAIIEDTERVPTKDTSNDNEYLNLKISITEGDYKGRIVFERLNIWNSNPKAVNIAKDTLYDICHAINVPKVQNHEELRYKELGVKIAIEKSEQYGDKNVVKKFMTKDKVLNNSAPQSTGSSTKKPW